MLILHIQIL